MAAAEHGQDEARPAIDRGRAARGRAPWGWVDAALIAVLYAGALAAGLLSVLAVGTGQVLTGEEMSVSVRDVLFSVEQHTQASVWSTNVGAPAYYWLASHLDPDYSLFSARRWKAGAMALLAPLAYLVLRRRLDCTRGTALLGGATTAVIPGVAMFSWLATENGLETLVGAAGLYLATSGRAWWRAAPLLAGLAVITHTSGLAWAAVIVAVCAWRAARSPDHLGVRLLGVVVLAVAVPVGVVLSPRLWWTAGPERLVVGGGTVEGTPLDNLANLVRQLAVNGESYYYAGTQPALGSTLLALATAVAAVLAATRRTVWPWLAVAVLTVVMWLPAGNAPGVRRAAALSVVAALVLAVAVDVVWRAAPRGGVAAVLAGAAAAIVLPLAATTAAWQQSHASGELRLRPDFPIPPGPMPATFARYDKQLRDGTLTVDDMIAHHDGLRTLAVVWMLADRTGRGTEGLPDPREIVAETVPDAAERDRDEPVGERAGSTSSRLPVPPIPG